MRNYIHPSWCFYAMVWGVIAGVSVGQLTHWALCGHMLWLVVVLLIMVTAILKPMPITAALAGVAGFCLANFRMFPDASFGAVLDAIGSCLTSLSTAVSSGFGTFFADLVRERIPSPAVELGLGYLMGQKAGLSSSFTQALSAVGMNHAVVASGTHLGIIAGFAKTIFGKISRFASTFFAIIIILAFVLVVGFTPSMTRAALVALLGLLTGYAGRKFTPLRLLSLVAAMTLLISPDNLLQLGWQLSFASFAGILLLGPNLLKFLYGGKKPPFLANMLVTSFATLLVCAPVLIYNFGTISLLSFVANLVILPTLPYAMLLVLLTGALSFFSPVANVFAFLSTLLLNLHIWLIETLSTQSMFILEFSKGKLWVFLLYLPIVGLMVFLQNKGQRDDEAAKRRRRGRRQNPRESPLPGEKTLQGADG